MIQITTDLYQGLSTMISECSVHSILRCKECGSRRSVRTHLVFEVNKTTHKHIDWISSIEKIHVVR